MTTNPTSGINAKRVPARALVAAASIVIAAAATAALVSRKPAQILLDREGNEEIQLALFDSYGSNPPLYPEWQSYFREHRPPTLLTWGKNDPIFPEQGAYPYKHDLKNLEFHILDTGHFALEEDGAQIASLMREFLGRNVDSEK